MLFQTCSKFTFSLSDVFVVTVITRNRISGVGLLFFNDRILWFGKNLPQSLKSFLSNFNIVGIQNSLDGFHNTLNVGNNNTTSRWFPFIRSATGTGVLLGKPATGCVVIPYIQGVMEPIKRILNSHNVKVAQKPFQTLGQIFAKPKDPVIKEQ